MGKFDGIIIVSDIDGTFLGKNSRIVPENIEAIEYFKKEGGCFTIATGREVFSIPRCIPMVKELCNIPIIACNGAFIYDLQEDRIVTEEFLPEPEISAIVDAVRAACPEVSMRIACCGKQVEDKDYPIIRPVREKYRGYIEIVPYEEIPHGCWHQITWMDEPERMERVRQVVEPLLKGGCVCAMSGRTMFEIFSVRGTKGAMLSRLKQLTGRESAELWAIGDYENDLLMLQMADRCAMPANGIDKLRKIPGMVEVCSHDEGAIAGLIRHIEAEIEARKGAVPDGKV
ncbi:MAG: HAD-IIB family hydrolase [Clostridia bacterium]|nr:HAD-IIB family hydrolase [Clostridia bacterium]